MRSVKENKPFVIAALNAHFVDGNSYIREKENGIIEINDEEGRLNPFLEFCADQLSNVSSAYYKDYLCRGDIEDPYNGKHEEPWIVYETALKDAGIKKTSELAKIYVEEFGDGHVWEK